MRIIGIVVVATAALAGPAGASVVVLGNSIGHSCYQAALDRNRSDLALKSCDDALESGQMSFHDIVATFVNRGIVKLHREDYRPALADFDHAIALDPAEPESYLNKGSALLRMGADPRQAIALFDEALERNTTRPELAYFSRAIAHEVSGDLQQAYNDYRRAQLAAPKWQEPGRELSRFQIKRVGGSTW